MKNATAHAVTREYKSRVFIMLFHDRKRLLELYNAVSGKHYQNPEALQINTLDNAVYLSMKNDLSFLIDCRLSLYEHQSTYNPNMPLRFLFYVSDLYSSMIVGKNMYGSKLIALPAPTFLVFYNGTQEEPDEKELRLSDSYEIKEDSPSLDLVVRMLNINAGHNDELMHSCKTLREYAEYVRRIREHTKMQPIEEAVEQTITECISDDILRDFLLKNRAEVKSMSIYEYNEEEHMRMEREEYFEMGYQKGREEQLAIVQKERQRADQEHQRAAHAEELIQQISKQAESADAKIAQLQQEIARLKNQ